MNILDQLKKYDDLYYESGTSPISDTDYDILKSEAKRQFPNDPYFKLIGAKVKANKTTLPYLLGSLDKKKLHDVNGWLSKYHVPFVISEKLDGMSFYVEYANGNVKFGTTRGDGYVGQDITHKLKVICPTIKDTNEIHLRGELMILGNEYKDLGYKTRRNTVPGIINRDDFKNVEIIVPFFYEVIYHSNQTFDSEWDRMNYLESLKLRIPQFVLLNKVDNLQLVEILKDFRDSTEYDIDGLVLTPDNYVREDVEYPEHKKCFKVNEDAKRAKVLDVRWQVGRTGRITPVVEIEPTEILGVTVSNVTAFNYKYVVDNSIGIGSEIGIIRAGDVIPYITEVFKPTTPKIITYCPLCKSKLIHKGVDLVCNNPDCNMTKKITYFFKILGAENFSEKTVKNLKMKSIEDAYEIDEFDISMIDGFGLKRAEMIVEEISKTLLTTEDRLLASFGIPGIGVENAKKILSLYTFNDIINNNLSILQVARVDGIGPVVARNLTSSINKYKPLYEFLVKKGLTFKSKKYKKDIKNKLFALTGAHPEGTNRDKIIEEIESAGGQVKGITKNTNYLVCANINSTSGKMKKAKELKIKIITYQDLEKLLNG